MWLMILMSGRWHARDYGGEDTLRYNLDDVFEHVNNANVVSICDDLDWWCDEMNVNQEDVIIVGEDDE